MFRTWIRGVRLLLTLLAGIRLTLFWSFRRDADRRPQGRRQRWYQQTLQRMGIEVEVLGHPHAGPALLVANHISWLDIPVLGAALDPRFIAKQEIRRWPVLGWLAQSHGTLFLQRGAHQTAALLDVVTEALRQGQSMVVFPEGTTTCGDEVRRFHARIFAAAIAAQVPVWPIALEYARAEPSGLAVAPYVGQDVLLPHLWRLLHQERVRVRVHLLAPIPVTPETTRRLLAETARQQVLQALGLPQDAASPSTPVVS